MKRLNLQYKVTTRVTPPSTAEDHERMRIGANILVKWLCLKDEEFKNYNESGFSIDEYYQTLVTRASQKRKAKRITEVLQEERSSSETYIS
jgi:hypothetical protein